MPQTDGHQNTPDSSAQNSPEKKEGGQFEPPSDLVGLPRSGKSGSVAIGGPRQEMATGSLLRVVRSSVSVVIPISF